jgi:hypothetical protein
VNLAIYGEKLISLRDYAPGPTAPRSPANFKSWRTQVWNIAYVLEAIAAERAINQAVEDLVEVVWTGPESIQSATRDTGVVVRELFAHVCEEVLIAGYADCLARLAAAHRSMRNAWLSTEARHS